MREGGAPEWRSATIAELADVRGGKRLPLGHEYSGSEADTPYLRVVDFDRMTVLDGDLRRVSGETSRVIDRYRITVDDVYVSIAGTIGKVGLVPARLSGAHLTENAARLTNLRGVTKEYLCLQLNGPAAQEQIRGLTKSTGQPKLGLNRIEQISVLVPPLADQRRIVAHLDACFARTKRAKAALDEVPALLDRLRQSILAAAFRGDLTADWRAEHPDVEPASELLKRIRVERRRRWEEAELAKMVAKGKAPKDGRWKAKYEEPEPVDESELPELPEGWCWAPAEEVEVPSVPLTPS